MLLNEPVDTVASNPGCCSNSAGEQRAVAGRVFTWGLMPGMLSKEGMAAGAPRNSGKACCCSSEPKLRASARSLTSTAAVDAVVSGKAGGVLVAAELWVPKAVARSLTSDVASDLALLGCGSWACGAVEVESTAAAAGLLRSDILLGTALSATAGQTGLRCMALAT